MEQMLRDEEIQSVQGVTEPRNYGNCVRISRDLSDKLEGFVKEVLANNTEKAGSINTKDTGVLWLCWHPHTDRTVNSEEARDNRNTKLNVNHVAYSITPSSNRVNLQLTFYLQGNAELTSRWYECCRNNTHTIECY